MDGTSCVRHSLAISLLSLSRLYYLEHYSPYLCFQCKGRNKLCASFTVSKICHYVGVVQSLMVFCLVFPKFPCLPLFLFFSSSCTVVVCSYPTKVVKLFCLKVLVPHSVLIQQKPLKTEPKPMDL